MEHRPPSYAWTERAHQMGQLTRGDVRWEVWLECRADDDRRSVWGRVHFVAGERHRQSPWIFLEHTEKEVRERFAEFSAVELWSLLDALAP